MATGDPHFCLKCRNWELACVCTDRPVQECAQCGSRSLRWVQPHEPPLPYHAGDNPADQAWNRMVGANKT